MFKSCRDYFIQMVVPTYNAFFDARAGNRYGESQLVAKGVDAANCLFHLREHLPETSRPSRDELQRQYSDYRLVADIANVSKHNVLTRAAPRISSAKQISEIMVVTEYRDAQGEYTSAQADVRVTLDDGTVEDLARILHSVFSMWCVELKTRGFGDFKNPQLAWTDTHVERADAKSAPIEQLAGEQRSLQFQFCEYDYTECVSKPKDLTGSGVTMNVYRLPESVPITLRSDTDSALQIDVDIPLTTHQAQAYVALPEGAEQQAFLAQLIESDETLQQTVRDALMNVGAAQEGPINEEQSWLRRSSRRIGRLFAQVMKDRKRD